MTANETARCFYSVQIVKGDMIRKIETLAGSQKEAEAITAGQWKVSGWTVEAERGPCTAPGSVRLIRASF